jgi:hypothetical protein
MIFLPIFPITNVFRFAAEPAYEQLRKLENKQLDEVQEAKEFKTQPVKKFVTFFLIVLKINYPIFFTSN